MADNKRFKEMMEYLKKNRYIRNQQDFTERVNSDKTTVSQIMNDKISIPNIMFGNISAAFPFISIEWLKNGDGDMLKSTYTQNISGGENISQTGNISTIPVEVLIKAIDEIAEMRKALTEALHFNQDASRVNQQNTARLLTILEKITLRKSDIL